MSKIDLVIDSTGCISNLATFCEYWAKHILKSNRCKSRATRSRSVDNRLRASYANINQESGVMYREIESTVWGQLGALVDADDFLMGTELR